MTLETTAQHKDKATRQAIAHHLDEYPLGEIAMVQQGYTFSPSYQGQATGKWLYVKVGDLNAHGNTKYLDRTLNYVDDIVLEEMGATPFPPGSIVFPRVGAALRNNNKRILRYASLTDDNVIVVTVRDTHSCSAEYLYYWFDFQDLQRFCNDGTVPVINGTNLKRQRIPLPSFALQQEIASLLSSWDTAIQKTEQLIAAKERHYSHELSRLIRRGKHPHGHVDTFAEDVSARNLGAKWRTVSLSDIATVWKGQQLNKDAMVEEGAYYALNGGIKPSGRTTEWNCEADTITVSEGGNSCGFVSYNRKRFWCGGHCYALKELAKNVDAHYLFHYLKGKQARVMALRVGSGLPNIQKSDIEAFPVVLPDLATQSAIARYLNALREEIDLLGQSTAALKTQKRGLMQKLLTGEWRVPVTEAEVA